MRNAIFDPVFVKEKKILLGRASEERALLSLVRTRSSHVCLSAMVPAFAEPDIHSLSQILADRHRRLSVCSLPVLKQSGESLGSLISVAQSATAGPGSLRAVIPVVFLAWRAAVSKPLRSGNRGGVRSRVAPDPRRADTPPFSERRLASLDWHFLFVFLFHRPGPDYDPVGVPALRPPPAHAGYVCCAVWKAVYASFCRQSFFRHHKARSN